MNLTIFHSLPLLDASLDSTGLAWLIGGLVVALIVIVAGVLVTAPSRRGGMSAALAKPDVPLAAATPAPEAAAEPLAVATSSEEAQTPAAPPPVADLAPPSPAIPPAPSAAVESVVPTPTPPPVPAVSASESSQTASPIPVGPDFSASGPIMLPGSMVAATYGAAADVPPVTSDADTTDALTTSSADAPAPGNTLSPSTSVSGPMMLPPTDESSEPVAPATPFVVTPSHVEEPAPPPAALATGVASLAANGAAPAERVSQSGAVDLFAHSYGRTNAAMLSATERAAAGRIARALQDDPLAVQLAGRYAAETQRSPDGLAQLLESDQRNGLALAGERRTISDADALDVFAGSYGRSNAAMLSATERAAAGRIVHTLGDDPLAVRLAGRYAAETHHPLDALANRLETDLRHAGGYNGHA